MQEDHVHRKSRASTIGAVASAFVRDIYVYASVSGSLQTNGYMERLLRNFHETYTRIRTYGDSTA